VNRNKIQEENLSDFTSDAIITIGTRISDDNPKVKRYIDTMIQKENGEFIYMHPIDDISLQDKYTQYIKYEAGSEEGVMAFLASYLTSNVPQDLQNYFEDLDIGYLSGESSVGEEEFELLVEKLTTKKEITLLIGEDLYGHTSFKNIAQFIRLIDLYTDINVVLLHSNIQIDLSDPISLEEVSAIETYNGSIVYTIDCDSDILKGSASFAMAAKIKDADMVTIKYKNTTVKKQFLVDANIRGTIALYPLANTQDDDFSNGYRFKQVKIEKAKL